ncbi:peptidoglycan-binding domain-containing protein [Dactylosporangium sp. McL0621]|uniref:peptidoglycan-binding domain-containing protein n=1 Tax=Dactylosporangium sp. McL0621 TaxID=3415678 RepID=UPI003CEDA3D0
MSVNAPGLTLLRRYADEQIGKEHFLGIVGDVNHTSGYHLGPDRIHGPDYSMTLDRDVTGARTFPTAACAYDIGMGWPAARAWLAWLVNECRSGAFPQVREIIGSLDGVHKQYFGHKNGFATEGYDGDNHVSHSHISVFRDTAATDHSPLLRRFFERTPGRAAPPFPGRLLKFTEGQPRPRGEDVRTWQARMLALGFTIEVDGIYGPKSRAVAVDFQRRHGLQADGIVGPKTWAASFAQPVG